MKLSFSYHSFYFPNHIVFVELSLLLSLPSLSSLPFSLFMEASYIQDNQ